MKEISGLRLVEITHGVNGYPKDLGDQVIIGWDSFEQLQKFAESVNMNSMNDIHLVKQRDGWHFWEDLGYKAGPLTVDDYLRDLGDDYRKTDYDDARDTFNSWASDCLNDSDSIEVILDNVTALTNQFHEIVTEISHTKEYQVVILYQGKYYDTADREMMSYKEDVWTYAIGLFLPKEMDEDEE